MQRPSCDNGGGVFDQILQLQEKPLHEEELMLANGSHSEYLTEIGKLKNDFSDRLEAIALTEMNEIARIESVYRAEMNALEKEYEQRLTELSEVLHGEIEDKKRQIETEIHGLDIAVTSPVQSNNSYYTLPNKKTLRRRMNNEQQPVETSSEKSRGTKRPAPHAIVQLLPDSIISSDVRLMCGNSPVKCTVSTSSSGSVGLGSLVRVNSADSEERQRKVVFENNRLVYDGKNFHRGQNVTIQTVNYGRFSAILQTITDKPELQILFRSAIPGDTRQVTATKDDLESGRVVVRKRY